MTQITLPFAPGDIVGVYFMSEAMIVDEVVVYEGGITYRLNTCYEPHRRVGSFEAGELYELEKE